MLKKLVICSLIIAASFAFTDMSEAGRASKKSSGGKARAGSVKKSVSSGSTGGGSSAIATGCASQLSNVLAAHCKTKMCKNKITFLEAQMFMKVEAASDYQPTTCGAKADYTAQMQTAFSTWQAANKS
jgi:hypothetical protein